MLGLLTGYPPATQITNDMGAFKEVLRDQLAHSRIKLLLHLTRTARRNHRGRIATGLEFL